MLPFYHIGDVLVNTRVCDATIAAIHEIDHRNVVSSSGDRAWPGILVYNIATIHEIDRSKVGTCRRSRVHRCFTWNTRWRRGEVALPPEPSRLGAVHPDVLGLALLEREGVLAFIALVADQLPRRLTWRQPTTVLDADRADDPLDHDVERVTEPVVVDVAGGLRVHCVLLVCVL